MNYENLSLQGNFSFTTERSARQGKPWHDCSTGAAVNRERKYLSAADLSASGLESRVIVKGPVYATFSNDNYAGPSVSRGRFVRANILSLV